ncbi:hypothetical protein MESS2_730077 [Mesorhizobium metallidurans STM 2683]|uniref:Uncharacterized protein n=1 Tax=Mesorhizobium metallidurans STM 2683 TaxID=1297569 RepID=M5F8E9_9HYPH|nr:hypothetical protein MESS2_730077 [Mesorhizobium metallidurans STM 2683]
MTQRTVLLAVGLFSGGYGTEKLRQSGTFRGCADPTTCCAI